MNPMLKSSILSRVGGRVAGWLDSIENKTKQGQIAWFCFAFGLCLAISKQAGTPYRSLWLAEFQNFIE